jgi:TfoX/Sxy family transcriptional regulator of competence genes
MPWSKPPQALVELFTESLPDDPGVQRRKMFGLPSAFVNGVMFAGVFQDSMFARLPLELAATLERDYGATAFEPMPSRPMKAYLVLPDDILADEDELAAALSAAFLHTAALPPKVSKPKTTGRKAKAAKA